MKNTDFQFDIELGEGTCSIGYDFDGDEINNLILYDSEENEILIENSNFYEWIEQKAIAHYYDCADNYNEEDY